MPESKDLTIDSLAVDCLPRVYSMVVAAGKGSRFGTSVPKQYTPVLGSTVLELSVTALSLSQYINELFLVIAKNDHIAKSLDYKLPITFVEGGNERWQSVQAGVDAIINTGADYNDLILIHDAARPCVLETHINAVIKAASDTEYGAILGVPVADTLKKVDGKNTIDATVDRSHLWQAQTPQVFRAGKLKEVLRQIAKKGIMITDEASAFEILGYPIKIVQGNYQNSKLTYPEDLALIEAILSSRH